MKSETTLFVAALAPMLFAGCSNKNYCAGNPHDDCRLMWDAPAGFCTSDEECSAPTSVCDVDGTKTCVQCTSMKSAACTGTTPVCGSDDTCVGCSAHPQCASDACLPDGSCGDDSNVAYVDPNGTDNTTCSKAMPCTKVAKALATGRAFVKFHGTTDEAVTVSGGRVVTFIADPAAKLTLASAGAIVTVRDDNTKLTVYDLSISDGQNVNTVGLVIPAASGAPKLTLSRVKVMNNPGGGLSIAGGSFELVGNLFYNNGTGGSTIGGISILTVQSTNRLEFNSIVRNLAMDTIGAGVQCTAGTFTARNNIIYDNGTATNLLQVAGSCMHAYSDVGPMGTAGATNLNMPPMFVDEATGNLHIQSTSPARHAADPGTDLSGIASRDIDGDPRIAPADIGADQVP